MTHREVNRVEMQAELGVAHWGSNTKQIAFRTVELTEDGTIRTRGSIQLVAGVRQNTNQPSAQTTYHCGDPDRIVVEYLDRNNQWIDATVDAKKTKAEIPWASDLRVTRHDRQLMILDRYVSPNSPTAVVEYLPQAKSQVAQVRVTVHLGTVSVNTEQPTTYLERELRITPLE